MGAKTNVHFQIDLKKDRGRGGVDPSARKLISSFHPSDYYQLETQQLHSDTTMKISHFMMKITCDDTRRGGNLANSLIHHSKLMTLAECHSVAVQEDEDENDFAGSERKKARKGQNSPSDRDAEGTLIGHFTPGYYDNDSGDIGGGGDIGEFFDGDGGYDRGDNGFGGGDGGGGGEEDIDEKKEKLSFPFFCLFASLYFVRRWGRWRRR
jgi:hypothetical protein